MLFTMQKDTQRSRIIIFFIFVLFACLCETKTLQKPLQVTAMRSHGGIHGIHATTTSTSSSSAPLHTATSVLLSSPLASARDINVGPCTWAIERTCPDHDVKFYLYTRKNPSDRQFLYIDRTLEKSNITQSYFNPKHSTKIIIHGYNSDMFLHPLYYMREEYLTKDEHNIIYVDWSILAPGPCYISAVHNTRHVGACIALLVQRIRDMGSTDMHVIGFSLGAQVPNYIAKNVEPFVLPRITGLDPALPFFITASPSEKLDASDAQYVDVIHTNALVQGQLERCGHADFYMNGGIMQPGCSMGTENSFACSHQRAPAYFLESINSEKGFWGWSCSSYIAYLLGMCPATNYLVEAGDCIKQSTHGMYIIETNNTMPYALGKWTDLPTLGDKNDSRSPALMLSAALKSKEPLMHQVDPWGKLDGNFNNLQHKPTPYSQDPYGDNWTYFSRNGPREITNDLKDCSEGCNNDDKRINVRATATTTITTQKPLSWTEYHKNLTSGFIANEVFRLPQVKTTKGI